ncbi:unnamed protein product [Gongylonema pulchrum]|uniref:PH domain-containing protein n=1 Tax=Gongylonema pulchrum TaxID=637853 RepID=A0A183DJ41_9BILA|nr:unnamed protein product [Gongylonema pulchrum]
MRNMWFGGDYLSESLESGTIHFHKKKQKRWWNAYLLIYEKVNYHEIDVN